MASIEDKVRDLAEEFAALHRQREAMVNAGDIESAAFKEATAARDSRARIIALIIAKHLNIEV